MFAYSFNGIDISHKFDDDELPPEDFEIHMHPYYEILLLVGGMMEFTVESRTKKVHPGEIVLIKPSELHFATVDLTMPYERYVVKFPADIMPKFLQDRVNSCHNFGNSLLEDTVKAFKIFDDYNGTYDDGDEMYLLFTCRLLEILTELSRSKTDTGKKHAPTQNVLIEQITNYISDNLQKNITLDDLSADLHYSKSYISGEFSKALKMPIMSYIKYKKIMAANSDIVDGHRKTGEVALKYGFEEYSTFYRNYLKIIGHPPVYDRS